ncbi:MAG TPA: winged helix-turn-helix domain-containing protein [Kiritimatiellia bacterium]|nr:winged helix-turn-helix domain-containing protein [Kiritimatiellia bacterium]
MIMTSTKSQRSTAWDERHLPAVTTLLSDGLSVMTTTRDVAVIDALADDPEADSMMITLLLPLKKGAAICRLLEDHHGDLPGKAVLLKTCSLDESAATCPEHDHPSSPHNPIDLRKTPHEIHLDEERHEVRVDGNPIALTFSEYKILRTLVRRPGKVFTREEIITSIQGEPFHCTKRAVDVHLSGLRRKLGPAGARIVTVRSIGYRYSAD